jgi:hypothetical protein
VRDDVAVACGQAEADAAFDALLARARELQEDGNLDSFVWPSGVPAPTIDNKFDNQQDEAAFDLACIAGAYIFLHEIQHVLFQRNKNAPPDLHDEELECDRFARHFLSTNTPANTPYPQNRFGQKRALGIAVAKTILLEVTPLANWQGGKTHPAVALRVKSFLKDLDGPVTNDFWIGVDSFLAAMCRVRGRLPAQITFNSPRELAFALADCL